MNIPTPRTCRTVPCWACARPDRYPGLFVNAVRRVAVGDGRALRSPGLPHPEVVDKTHCGGVPGCRADHARHILLRVGAGLSERQAAERLEELRQRVLRGQADFAALARSTRRTAAPRQWRPGLGRAGRYVPEFEQALNALRPERDSQPVVSRFGVHLIELLERREAELTPARAARHGATRCAKKLDEAFTTRIQEARGRATSNTTRRTAMKHIARKRFGQHFLTDGGIIDAIVRAIDPRPGEPMVEIGPGLAALTQPLVERLGRLTVIELDRDLAARLRQHGQLDVIESDVLKGGLCAGGASAGMLLK